MLQEIRALPAYSGLDTMIITYCVGGNRSVPTANWLWLQGYTNVFDGGSPENMNLAFGANITPLTQPIATVISNDLSWNAVPNAASYRVFAFPSNLAVGGVPIAEFNPTNNTAFAEYHSVAAATVTGVGFDVNDFSPRLPDGTYVFRVQAIPGGTGSNSLLSAVTAPVTVTTPTVTFNPSSTNISNTTLTQTVNVIGTATGDISINYNNADVPEGVTIVYDAPAGTITIVGTRPTTNVPPVTGSFTVTVTREGVIETFTVNVSLTTTFTPPSASAAPQTPAAPPAPARDSAPSGPAAGTPAFTHHQTVAGANRAVSQISANVSNSTTADAVLAAVSAGLPQGALVRWSSSTPFAMVPATNTQDGSITGLLIISVGTYNSAISLDITIPSLGGGADAEITRTFTLQLDSTAITDQDGNMITMDVLPVVQDGRTLLPVRFIAQALGANVSWNPNTYEVTLTQDGQSLTFAIGETAPGMDVPAQIIGDRTMVPLRFISEFFGADVAWHEAERTIEIIR